MSEPGGKIISIEGPDVSAWVSPPLSFQEFVKEVSRPLEGLSPEQIEEHQLNPGWIGGGKNYLPTEQELEDFKILLKAQAHDPLATIIYYDDSTCKRDRRRMSRRRRRLCKDTKRFKTFCFKNDPILNAKDPAKIYLNPMMDHDVEILNRGTVAQRKELLKRWGI